MTRRADLGEYGVVVRKTAGAKPEAFRFGDPLDALLTAIEYLRDAYWVRLTDHTLDGLARMPGDGGTARLMAALHWYGTQDSPP